MNGENKLFGLKVVDRTPLLFLDCFGLSMLNRSCTLATSVVEQKLGVQFLILQTSGLFV